METKHITLKGLLFIATLLFSQMVFAFNTLNIISDYIRVDSASYFETSDSLTAEDAIKHNFTPISEQAVSVGIDKSDRWFRFELSAQDNLHDHVYLEYQNKIAPVVELFVFRNNQMIRHEVQGYNVDSFQATPIRFELEHSSDSLIYLVKVRSILSDFIVFNIGNAEELNQNLELINVLVIITISAITILIIYNFFLFLSTKETAYFYYVLYIGALLLLDVNIRGLLPLHYASGEMIDIYLTSLFMVQLEQIGLVFFTIKFLDLEKTDPLLKKYLMIVFYIDMLLTPTLLIGFEVAMLIAVQLMGAMLLYAGIRSMFSGNKAALYYTLATGVALVLLSLWLMSMLNILVPVTLWSNSLCHLAIIWDGLMLSFALAYRIRYLQKEKLNSERLLMLKSRQNHIGELSGNIAHQWRQPLSELGAIMANLEAKLKYAEQSPKKEDILKTVKQSTGILRHLSNTITTFQSFFQNQKHSELFNVSDELQRSISFVTDSMNHHHIQIRFEASDEVIIQGDANAFSQAVLSILLNAKDVLLTRNISDPLINIFLVKQQDAVTIMISDNGGGIKIEPIMSIFDSYVTDKDHGSGIGLFITKSIIEKGFNGSVRAKNDKNGACFEIRIPCVS